MINRKRQIPNEVQDSTEREGPTVENPVRISFLAFSQVSAPSASSSRGSLPDWTSSGDMKNSKQDFIIKYMDSLRSSLAFRTVLLSVSSCRAPRRRKKRAPNDERFAGEKFPAEKKVTPLNYIQNERRIGECQLEKSFLYFKVEGYFISFSLIYKTLQENGN